MADGTASYQYAAARAKGKSRLFYLAMTAYCFVILVVVVIALGVFATYYKTRTDDLGCVLFLKANEEPNGVSEDHLCYFVLWGEAGVAVGVAILVIVGGTKVVTAPKVLSILTLLELYVSILCTLGAFAVGIVLTAGLNTTRSNFRYEHASMVYELLLLLQSSENASWVSTCMLFSVVVVYVLLLIVRRQKNKSSDYIDLDSVQNREN